MAEVNKSVGNENAGASAGASAGTEVTNTSVSAGVEVGAEAHAGVENSNQVGDVTISQEAHADAEVHAEATAEAGWDGRNATVDAHLDLAQSERDFKFTCVPPCTCLAPSRKACNVLRAHLRCLVQLRRRQECRPHGVVLGPVVRHGQIRGPLMRVCMQLLTRAAPFAQGRSASDGKQNQTE